MQVDLSRGPAAAAVAHEVVSTFPGTDNTTMDGSAVSCDIQFPGNLSALAARLHSSNVPIVGTVAVRIPIARVVPSKADHPSEVRAVVVEGTEIWDVEFPPGHYVTDANIEEDAVTATVLPTTYAMHQLYDTLLNRGIFSDDHTTSVAAK